MRKLLTEKLVWQFNFGLTTSTTNYYLLLCFAIGQFCSIYHYQCNALHIIIHIEYYIIDSIIISTYIYYIDRYCEHVSSVKVISLSFGGHSNFLTNFSSRSLAGQAIEHIEFFEEEIMYRAEQWKKGSRLWIKTKKWSDYVPPKCRN